MGGHPPLGYDVRERKLVINDAEVETVRMLFRRFAESGSATLLVKLVAKAHRWLKLLEGGKVPSFRAIAEQEKVDESYVGKVLCLTLLAPDIVEMIIDGRQPDVLTWRELRKPFPLIWEEQREKWGIPAPR